jgi:pumilio family protein 6
VLVDLYDAASTQQRNALASEAYGREFVLLGEGGAGVNTNGSAPLSHVRVLLEGSDASKRRAVVASLQRALEPVLEKGLLHPPLTHRLLREYLEVAPGSLIAEAVDTLAATGGNALKMVHTADGAAACCAAFAYGTAKDRKRLVKGMKGYVAQTASNEHAHAVVSTALTVTDDTALTGKVIVGELKVRFIEIFVVFSSVFFFVFARRGGRASAAATTTTTMSSMRRIYCRRAD